MEWQAAVMEVCLRNTKYAPAKRYGIRGMKDPNTVEDPTIKALRLASDLSTSARSSSYDIMNSSIAFGFFAILFVRSSSSFPS